MHQIVGRNPASAIGDSKGDLKSNTSVSRPLINDIRLAAQAAARFIESNAPEILHIWVKKRQEVFSIKDVADECFDGITLTRGIETRIGIILKNLGCTRFERKTAAGRKWYIPPE